MGKTKQQYRKDSERLTDSFSTYRIGVESGNVNNKNSQKHDLVGSSNSNAASALLQSFSSRGDKFLSETDAPPVSDSDAMSVLSSSVSPSAEKEPNSVQVGGARLNLDEMSSLMVERTFCDSNVDFASVVNLLGIHKHEQTQNSAHGLGDISGEDFDVVESAYQTKNSENHESNDSATISDNPIRKIWRKTGERAIRKHHDVLRKIHELGFEHLSEKEKRKIRREHLPSYLEYKHGRGREKAEHYKEKRESEIEKARKFLETYEYDSSSMLTTGKLGKQDIGLVKADGAIVSKGLIKFKTLSDEIDKVRSKVIDPADKTATYSDVFGDLRGYELLSGEIGGGMDVFGNGIGVVSDAVDVFQEAYQLAQKRKSGKKIEFDDVVGMTGNVSSVTGNVGKVVSQMGGTVGGSMTAISNLAGGATTVYEATKQIKKGAAKKQAMDKFTKTHFSGAREDLTGANLVLRDTVKQGGMEGTREKTAGVGKAIAGGLSVAGGVASLSGAGAPVGSGIRLSKQAIGKIFAIIDDFHRKNAKKEVVQQTTGLTNEKIQKFQKQSGIKSFSRAKQALMKAMNYTTGFRAELFADQTEQRAYYLSHLAINGNKTVQEILQGLGLSDFRAREEIAKALGLLESREKIIKGQQLV